LKEEKAIQSQGNSFDYVVLKRLIKFISPYKKEFFALIFITLTSGILPSIIPLLIRETIKYPIANKDFEMMLSMLIIMLLVLFLQAIVQYVNTYLSGWVGQHVIKDIRVALYKHITRLKLSFFDQTPIGRLVTRNISDVESLSEVFSQGIAQILSELLQVIFIVIVMFILNWRLALIGLSMFPFMLISTYVFKEKIKASFSEVRAAVSNLNSFVQERITGMSIVQLFNTEQREYQKFVSINQEHKKSNLKSVKYYSIYFPVVEVVGALGIGLLVWIGAGGVFKGWVSGPEDLIAFVMLIGMFFRPLRMIADRFNTIQMGLISTQRILMLLDSQENVMREGTIEAEKLKGKVIFNEVYFAYTEDDYVLKNISFEVKPGETVAFVGATGAGKSSIINLLNRYYEINKGSILIDNIPVQDYRLNSLRKNIGVVLQDVFLFSGTIRYNIALGDLTISDEQIWTAAKLIGADGFINDLPGQLAYEVQERGATLSMGQRQLISFVRVMVYNPQILVLDEATSSVDTETEQEIQQAIQKMMQNRSALVIAHRLSTIQQANKIIVLDKGEVLEMGTHDELLNKKGKYSELFNIQYNMQQK
jgi:ATP-binding cassette, subfamily B, multidrug efflux pump